MQKVKEIAFLKLFHLIMKNYLKLLLILHQDLLLKLNFLINLNYLHINLIIPDFKFISMLNEIL